MSCTDRQQSGTENGNAPFIVIGPNRKYAIHTYEEIVGLYRRGAARKDSLVIVRRSGNVMYVEDVIQALGKHGKTYMQILGAVLLVLLVICFAVCAFEREASKAIRSSKMETRPAPCLND
jgi:hypothetical protein